MTVAPISTMGSPVPYITVAELKRSPISGQLQKLVPNTSDADRDAELARLIMRVSAQINTECRQNLAATVNTETGWGVVRDDGSIRLHCRGNPVVEVLSVNLGNDTTTMRPVVDTTVLARDPWQITIPSWQFSRPGVRLRASWTYVSGYPVTTLSAQVQAGDTTLTVADPTGIVPGETLLTVEDGKWLERVVPTAVDGAVLTVPPLMFAHKPGVGVSSLPDDVKEALLLLISRFHDTWSLSSRAISTDGTGAKKPSAGPSRALCDAAVMLSPYRRLW